MRCTVCQQTSCTVGTMGWSLTSERTPCSQLQIIFKLFYITHLEFHTGAICPLCHELVVQIDTLEARLRSLADQGSEVDVDVDVDDLGLEKDASESKRRVHTEDVSNVERCNGTKANNNNKKSTCLASSSDSFVKMESSILQSGRGGSAEPESTALEQLKCERSKQKELDDVLECMGEGLDDNADDHHSHDVDEDEDYDDDDDSQDQPWGESTLRRGRGGRPRSTTAINSMEPKVAKANFSPENLDYDVMLSKTNRGKDMLVYKRHVYHGETRRGRSGYTNIFKWKCSVKHRFKGCKGRLTSSIDGSCVLKDSVVEHCHKPPHSNLTKRHQFKDYVRDLALNDPEMKPSDVIRNAQLLSSEDPETIGFSLKAITSFVQKVRRRSNYADNSNANTVTEPNHLVLN